MKKILLEIRIKKNKFNYVKNKKSKSGYISIFASLVLIFLLEISVVLINEGILYKKEIDSYEKDLKFDYRLETYYLMLNFKLTDKELDYKLYTPYGSLKDYQFIDKRDLQNENNFQDILSKEEIKKINYLIVLEKEQLENKDIYFLKSYKKGNRRKEYIIHELKN